MRPQLREWRAAADQPAILLVDDRTENLVALEAVLIPLGHRLVRAMSGREALREVLRHDFAVILMDVQMPEINGFETANLIKDRPKSREIPIIFLTAISKDEQYVFEGYSAGAVDYIFKPFHPEILRSKVKVFVDLYLKRQEIERQGEALRASERRELELRHRTGMLEAEVRHAQILDSVMDPIVTFGDDRRIRMFNTAAQYTFGMVAGDAIGRSIDEILRTGLTDGDGKALWEREPSREVRHGVAVRAGGDAFEAEFTLSTLEVADTREHTIVLRDVSQRKQTEALLRARTASLGETLEELRAVNEQLSERTHDLERAMGTRSRFYASMSHELRTPINAILGYSSLLMDGIFGPLNENQRGSLERTRLAATHLMELVNDILDLSKIEAGKFELKLEPVVLPDLIEELLATVEPLAQDHGVELQLSSSPDRTLSDPRRIRQIMLNLLSNAIKFGEGKPVRVTTKRDESDCIVIEVCDHGLGIAHEDQERIFEEFVQLESENKPGTGLGLPISRRLAELLGGSLTVRSVPGEGSTFRLSLPRVLAEDPERAHELTEQATE